MVLGAGVATAVGSVLVRYQISDRSAATIGAFPDLPFDGILGTLLDAGGSGRVAVFGCPDISGDLTLSTLACHGTDAVDAGGGPEGYLYAPMAPNNAGPTLPLYECAPSAGEHAVPTVSTQSDCERSPGPPGTLLGFALAPAGTLNRWLISANGAATHEWDTTGPVALHAAVRIIALGYPLAGGGANRAALYSCSSASGDHPLVVAPATCPSGPRGEGWIFLARPTTPPTVPLYRCEAPDGTDTATVHTTCPVLMSRATLLGYLPTAPLTASPPPPGDKDHDGIPDTADHCPVRAAGRYDRDHDGCPGPYRTMKVQASAAWTIPLRGVLLEALRVARVPAGATVLLRCASCHVSERRHAGGTKGTKTVRLPRLVHRTIRSGHSFTISVTARGYIGVLLRFQARRHGSSTPERLRANKHPFSRTTRCLPAGSSKPALHCSTRPA